MRPLTDLGPGAGGQRDTPVRVIIADDHPVVRIGVRNVLAAHGRFAVIAEAENGVQAVTQTIDLQPDIQCSPGSGCRSAQNACSAVDGLNPG